MVRPIYRGGRLIAYKDDDGIVVSQAKTMAGAPMARNISGELIVAGGAPDDMLALENTQPRRQGRKLQIEG